PDFPSPTEFVCNVVQQIAPGKAVAVANNGNIILFEEPCNSNPVPVIYSGEEDFIACNGDAISIHAGATGMLEWYDGENTNTANLVGSGNSFTTPILESDATFYVFNTACSNSQNETISFLAFDVLVQEKPLFTGSTDGNICGPGSTTIQGFADSGTIQWFDQETGGGALASGNDFETPFVNQSTLFFAEAYNGCYAEVRMPVIVNVNDIPQFTSVFSESVCDTNSTSAFAFGTEGTTFWYANASDSISIGSGAELLTPVISENTTYYAELVTEMGCVSEERAEVVIQVFQSPEVTEYIASPLCGEGYSELYASASGGEIYWMDQAIDGGVLATGSQSLSPLISENTTVYVVAMDGGCSSEPIPVLIEVYEAVTGSVLVNGTTLSASYGNVSYQWFDCNTDLPVEGANGASFTPEFSGNYYCFASNGQCSATSECYDVTITGIAEEMLFNLSIYPNPAKDFIRVQCNTNEPFLIYSMDGQLVHQGIIQPGQNIDISYLASGCYRLFSMESGLSATFIVK
ncbi:MAG: T9SS type A sorting domain-containing protein, partial [Flavobacteriales bacterium]